MRVSVCTLGCKVNHYESQILRRLFEERGDELVPFGAPCDLAVIHSCAVTEESSRKSRQMVRRARRISPDAVVAVVGCLTQVEPESCPEADIVLGNRDKTSLPALVDRVLAERTPVYEHVADCIVDVDGKTPQAIAEEILASLGEKII